MILRIQVCQLARGDVMCGSGETVESVSAGIATPRGKLEILLSHGERRRRAVWGKFTRVAIDRMSPDAAGPT